MNIAFYSITPLKNFKEATTLTIIGLAKELKKNGHQVVIITELAKGLPKFQKIEGVNIYRLYKIPLIGKMLSHPLALKKIQNKTKIKFDVIHSFSATPLFVLSNFISKLFSPKAKTIHTLKSYSRSRSNSWFFCLNLVDKVTVPTKYFANKLNQVKKNKVRVVYSPIDLNKFYPQNKEQLKEKYGYTGKKIIFYYGSFHEHKGVSNLIKAIPLVIKNNSNLKFIFSPRYAQIPKERLLVNKLGIQEFTNFITEDIPIQDYVNLADVVVLPYNNLIATEGNPSCLLEAMACKTLVVTSRLPELTEIVEEDKEVLMAEPKNIPDIAKKIKIALSKSNNLRTNKAFEKAQQFDLKKIAKEFINIYKYL